MRVERPLTKFGPPRQDPVELFFKRVAKGSDDECWRWLGRLSPNGYGDHRLDGRRTAAHRVSYLLSKGDVARGAVVMHSCDNKWRVNPKHLSVGAQQENVDDMMCKGRHQHGDRGSTSVLTSDQVMQIREARATGVKVVDLAEKFGVSPASISRAANGRTWAHLDRQRHPA